jgi:hypothetical protein
MAVENDDGLYVTQHAQHDKQYDDDWMHVVLVNKSKKTFFCHNLGGWECIKHLDLDSNGRTHGHGYLRTIERVYEIGIKDAAPASRKRKGAPENIIATTEGTEETDELEASGPADVVVPDKPKWRAGMADSDSDDSDDDDYSDDNYSMDDDSMDDDDSDGDSSDDS